MQAFKHRAWARTVTLIAAAALIALTGGCARSASDTSTLSGASPSFVAPTPGVADSGTGVSTEQGAPSAAPSKDGGSGSLISAPEKLVVVNKTLRIETDDVQAALTKIRDLATRDGGDITSMQVSTSVDQPVYPLAYDDTKSTSSSGASSVPLRGYVTVRVPAETYQAFIADAAKLGKVLYQSESSDDVTQQHVDMQARIDNLKAELTRLREMFAKATKVSDMLAIEQELTRVQGDIESMTAQIKYLERQAAMATVTVELTEPTPLISPAGGTDWGIQKAFTEAIRAFVSTMNDLIVMLGPVLALLIFVGLPAWFVVWAVRRIMRRNRPALAAVAPVVEPPAQSGQDTTE
jgi:hypothetical protein